MTATAAGRQQYISLPYLRQWREAKQLTREQLAAKAKISVFTLAKLELGDTKGARMSTVEKIAKALGLGWKLLRDTSPPAETREE